MNFKIKTEDEQRLDHIRELVESCEKRLMENERPRRAGITKEEKLVEARQTLLCTIRSIGSVVKANQGP